MHDLIRSAGLSEVGVLITGESGTGKSSLAKRIHDMGVRKGKSFVPINLATSHEGTLESELFGHERGAFTGADQKRIGKLQIADGGTVFLDEVGDLSLRLQARLLEFLQSKTITPVGSNREIKLDVRIIVATHRDLDQMALDGTFRSDLLYRLRVLTIEMTPLREMTTGFGPAVHKILEEYANHYSKPIHRLSETVVNIFETYHWPGNFRELRNAIDFAVLVADSNVIEVSHLPGWLIKSAAASTRRKPNSQVFGVAEIPLSLNFKETSLEFERQYFVKALIRCNWRVNATARWLGLNKTTFIRRTQKLGVNQKAWEAGFLIPQGDGLK